MNIQALRNFKEKLSQQAVVGPFSKTQDAALIEIMGHAGFDFVIIDLEHGPNYILSLQNLIRLPNCPELCRL